MMEHGQRLQAAQYRLAQHYLDKLHTAQRAYQQGNENAIHALALFDRDREQVKLSCHNPYVWLSGTGEYLPVQIR